MIHIKVFILSVFSILRSIWLVAKKAFDKRETRLYPDKNYKLSSRYRGRIVLTRDSNGNERCVACNLCAVVCPVGCISLKKKESSDGRWFPEFFRINFSRCIFCGMCEEACPTAAIQMTQDFELGEFKRDDLIYEKSDLLISGSGKNSSYNFYQRSGKTILGKNKGESKKEKKPISVKNILP